MGDARHRLGEYGREDARDHDGNEDALDVQREHIVDRPREHTAKSRGNDTALVHVEEQRETERRDERDEKHYGKGKIHPSPPTLTMRSRARP